MLERADPAWEPPPEAVITLTSENFNEVIGRESLIMVEFYAPWWVVRVLNSLRALFQ